MILAGLSGIIIVEIYAAVMQLEFQNSTNKVGKGFAILGIYLFVVTYCTCVPPDLKDLTNVHRWHAQQHHLVVWSGGATDRAEKQGYGSGRCVTFHRQCCQ